MTESEKVEAFDALCAVMANCWHDGTWSWWCPTMCGGPVRATRLEAVEDLVRWAHDRARRKQRVTLPEAK